jgi:sugar transferase (PEP-CTERM/EpsH1 system associated)
VFCLRQGQSDDANLVELRKYAQNVTAIDRSPIKEKLRGAKALLTGLPLSVTLRDETGLHHAVKSAFCRARPDLILVYSSNAAQFAADLTAIPRLMYFSDLDSMKYLSYAQRTRFPMNWVYRREGNLLLEHERHIARTFSYSLVCTHIERADFERLIPGAPVEVIHNGVDLDHFRSQNIPKHPGTMVFSGVMDYLPNVDACQWFCDAILPLVRKEVPHANFVICGRNPTAAVRRLARQPGVVVTGEVPDVRPHLDRAEICVVPVRIARGIQNKLLEGLAMGLPCISSRISWQGVGLKPGDGVLVADDAKGFVEHASRLLRDAAYRDQMARRARTAVDPGYTWGTQMQQLDRIIRRLVANAQEHDDSPHSRV